MRAPTSQRDGYLIQAREIEVHPLGLRDQHDRRIDYETTIEAIADPAKPDSPRSWRVTGQQLRDGHTHGRGTSAVHVFSVIQARAVGRTMFHKHRRYVERNLARLELKRLSAEEDAEALCTRY